MKQTFKKPSYYLLSQAMDGDEKAIEKILAFYDPYISKCCLPIIYLEMFLNLSAGIICILNW